MENSEPKRRGRPSAFSPERKATRTIHLNLGDEIWAALKDYSEETGEQSLSMAIRRIVRARLLELGYVREKVNLLSPAIKKP